MRFLAGVAIASVVLLPSESIARELLTGGSAAAPPAAVEPAAQSTARPLCQVADPICITAISGTAVVAVVAANAITGGALAPILLAGNGGATASVIAGLYVAHVGLELAVFGGGSIAAAVTGVADPVIAAAGDAYTTAKSYVVSAADSVSTAASDAATAVGNWLPGGGGQPQPAN